jgi:DNA repair photolyase
MVAAQLKLFEEERRTPLQLGPAAIAEKPTSKVLAVPKGYMADYDYTINPYVGCAFGCSYCYAAAFVADPVKRDFWGKWVEVKTGAIRELSRADLSGKKVYMSSSTDPYQPLEAKVELTRAILELLVEPARQPRMIVQTRSPLVTRDIDLIGRFMIGRVNMSITTDSDAVRKTFEPGCASIERRFEALEQLVAAKIPISVCVSPTLPIEDPERFAKRIAALKPVWVSVQKFHKSSRLFTSDTRPEAFKLAKEANWTEREFNRAIATMRKHLPNLKEGRGGFLPA